MQALKKIIYPISGNPPTWGHADLMMRAAALFDHVYWVAGVNIHKSLDFSVEERMEMMNEYVKYYGLKNVTVDYHQGVMVRYAEKKEAKFFLRGLRNSTDFQYELELSCGNRGIIKEIETICMFSRPHFATICSGLVRELATFGESIDQYVLPKLSERILKKLYIKKLK